MATIYADNYKKQYVDKPAKPYNKGEVAGRVRTLIGRISGADVAALKNGDDIPIGIIPKNSVIIDAFIKISKSLGATGIVTLGTGATKTEDQDSPADIAADPNSLVVSADGGGQAALARADLDSALIGTRLGAETLISGYCIEDAAGTVTDAEILFVVQYVND